MLNTIYLILIITIATAILLPVICWIISHKPNAV